MPPSVELLGPQN